MINSLFYLLIFSFFEIRENNGTQAKIATAK